MNLKTLLILLILLSPQALAQTYIRFTDYTGRSALRCCSSTGCTYYYSNISEQLLVHDYERCSVVKYGEDFNLIDWLLANLMTIALFTLALSITIVYLRRMQK